MAVLTVTHADRPATSRAARAASQVGLRAGLAGESPRREADGAHGKLPCGIDFSGIPISPPPSAPPPTLDLSVRLQTKLEIGTDNDPMEREADEVAESIVHGSGGRGPCSSGSLCTCS